ncbi:MAG: phage holin family protein, partial [Prosthecobacter sp.]|nr:phage holin family protein [Prosthecobacter sp.]
MNKKEVKGVTMTRFLLRWAINAAGLYAAIWIVPGIDYLGEWTGILWIALIFGLLNALVRPLLKFLTCPLIILTLGLFSIIVNTFMLMLTSAVGQSFGLAFMVDGFWSALLGSLVISLVSVVLSILVREELKG